ncbi:hypothetical protein K402DRAFT_398538 [Aulographum hederae CBS 113979]|uniref:Zn(2)-C6 fungal-type domain-containing protein n=1 Tax=Aulographum hederae CBS 113979 TaxID=1176131 RepID=A0A6G1GKS9_9PEZI|nr:hypothetical protein K402DRAFT_398538 [Aulographum hederae CBS 113979]
MAAITKQTTLRRSCGACIKAKRKCDIQAPQCGRCSSRGQACVYDNEPLTAWKLQPPRDAAAVASVATAAAASNTPDLSSSTKKPETAQVGKVSAASHLPPVPIPVPLPLPLPTQTPTDVPIATVELPSGPSSTSEWQLYHLDQGPDPDADQQCTSPLETGHASFLSPPPRPYTSIKCPLEPTVDRPLWSYCNLEVQLELDNPTISYMRNQLRSVATSFTARGGTLFIHPRLRKLGRPRAAQDVLAGCVLFESMGRVRGENRGQEAGWRSVASGVLEERLRTLVGSQAWRNGRFCDLLNSVQALALAMILRMFSSPFYFALTSSFSCRSPSSSASSSCSIPSSPFSCYYASEEEEQEDRKSISHYMGILHAWSTRLWRFVPTGLPSRLAPCEAFLFAESVRRTLIMTRMLEDIHSQLTRGFFRHTLFMESLPFHLRTELWERAFECDGEANMPDWTSSEALVSYREFTDMFEKGLVGLGDRNSFEYMLAVGCKGAQFVRARSAGSESPDPI